MKDTEKPFIQINIRGRNGFIDILYGENVGDPLPFTLTVTPQHVAHETQRTLPLNITELQNYVKKYADTKLKDLALNRRNAGFTSHVLD
jgi:hypothetical protein